MKKWLTVLLLAVCTALLCACGAAPTAGSGSAVELRPSIEELPDEPDEADLPYIGVVLKSIRNPYFALVKAGVEDAADELGIQVMVVSPESETSFAEQDELLATMANMAVDVIVVSPSNEAGMLDTLQQITDNGKLLLSVDTALDYEGCACYIGTDQYTAAYLQGNYAAETVREVESPCAVILRGPQGDKAHLLREYGLTDALEESGVQIVSVKDCGCDEKLAEETMKELLQSNPEIDLVCATTDSMAVGAQRAAAELGRRDIHFVSFDGMVDATELVRVGEIDAVFAQKPYEMGRTCIETALKLYQGETVEGSQHTGVERITAENAQAHLDEINRKLNHSKR